MRILMISNHLGVQSGVQRYVQNLLLNLDTAKYHIDLFVAVPGGPGQHRPRAGSARRAYHCGAGQ